MVDPGIVSLDLLSPLTAAIMHTGYGEDFEKIICNSLPTPESIVFEYWTALAC